MAATALTLLALPLSAAASGSTTGATFGSSSGAATGAASRTEAAAAAPVAAAPSTPLTLASDAGSVLAVGSGGDAATPASVLAAPAGAASAARRAGAGVVSDEWFTTMAHSWGWDAASRSIVGSYPQMVSSGLQVSNWPEVEPRAGHFDWTHLDREVGAIIANGDRPTVNLGYTPRHAVARAVGIKDPIGPGTSSINDVPVRAKWQTYVRAVTRHLAANPDVKGRVSYTIWNEPNSPVFWGGTVREMATLVADASRIIRAESPSSTVVSPPMPLRTKDALKWIDAFYNPAANGGHRMGALLDEAAFNPYPEVEHENANGWSTGRRYPAIALPGPERAAVLMREARRILRRHHVRLPLSINELNYGLGGGITGQAIEPRIPNPKGSGTISGQSTYISRTVLALTQQRLARIGWFRWDSIHIPVNRKRYVAYEGVQVAGWGHHPHAAPGTDLLSPAGWAWNNTIDLIRGWKPTGCHTRADRWTCTYRHPSTGATRTFIWTTSAVKSARSAVSAGPGSLAFDPRSGDWKPVSDKRLPVRVTPVMVERR